VNCSPFPISLSFWVELVGACNSIQGLGDGRASTEAIWDRPRGGDPRRGRGGDLGSMGEGRVGDLEVRARATAIRGGEGRHAATFGGEARRQQDAPAGLAALR
jgi:hypothetical protein